ADTSTHAIAVFNELFEFDCILGGLPEFCQALAHGGLRQKLRHHDGYRIRLIRRRITMLHDRRLLIAAVVPIRTLTSIPAAGGNDAVHDTQIVEYLLTARLNRLAACALEGGIDLVNQVEGDAAAGEIDCQCQACGAGAADEDVRRIGMAHCQLQTWPTANLQSWVIAGPCVADEAFAQHRCGRSRTSAQPRP